MGVEVSPITLNSNYGPITFNCWDCAGQEKLRGLGDGYYISGRAALLFYDVTCKNSFRAAYNYLRDVYGVCGKVPIVFCATKIDLIEKISTESNQKINDIPVVLLSSKDRINMYEPFLKLAEQLLMVNDIKFVE